MTYYTVSSYSSPMTSWSTYRVTMHMANGKTRAVKDPQGCNVWMFGRLVTFAKAKRAKGTQVLLTDVVTNREGDGLCHCTNCAKFHLPGDICPKNLDLGR